MIFILIKQSMSSLDLATWTFANKRTSKRLHVYL